MHETLLVQDAKRDVPPYAYTFMVITIFLEVAGTLLLKRTTEDARMYVPSYVLYFAGFSMFSVTLHYIPLSIAYASWCAFGTIGVTMASSIVYEEALSAGKWTCVLLTMVPMMGLYVVP